MRYTILSLFALFLFCLFPYTVSAEAVGLSPAKVSLIVYPGDILHEHFRLSRGDDTSELSLSIAPQSDGLIDIHGQDTFTIPAGQLSQDFFYDVDASHSSIGEYDEKILFIVKDSRKEENIPKNVLHILYGIAETVHISVVPRPDPSTVISLEDYPSLLSDISVTSLQSHQEIRNNTVFLQWSLENEGQNPLSGVRTDVVVARDDVQYFHATMDSSHNIPLQEGLAQTTSFVLDPSSPSGKYVATITVGDKTVHSSFWVIQKSLLLKIFLGVSGSLFFIVATLWIALTRKQKRRRLHSAKDASTISTKKLIR